VLRRPNRGITLVELLVALMLFGLVSAVGAKVVRSALDAHWRLIHYAELSGTLRTAAQVLRSDLIELVAAGANGSDISDIGRGLLEYRAMKGLFFVCIPPDTNRNAVTVYGGDTLRFPPMAALPLPMRDEFVVFAAATRVTSRDDRWLRRVVTDVASSFDCPGGEASHTIFAGGSRMAGVRVGAPVRVMRRVRIRAYADAYGDWWIGEQQVTDNGSWARIQPVVGPIVASGLEFQYFDRAGAPTTNALDVHRISVTIVAASRRPAAVRSRTMQLKLRTNPVP
jgi:prepilin-type N-terminal cleavage/methylation domain-containing protein